MNPLNTVLQTLIPIICSTIYSPHFPHLSKVEYTFALIVKLDVQLALESPCMCQMPQPNKNFRCTCRITAASPTLRPLPSD